MQNDNVILNLNLNFPLIQVWAQNGNENSVILYGLLLLIFHLHTFVDASWVHLFKLKSIYQTELICLMGQVDPQLKGCLVWKGLETNMILPVTGL